jgi:hypothetical protein
MTTKQKMISELKLEFPTLRIGNDDDGYINLSDEEYQTKISEWANARLAKLAKVAEAEAKEVAKAAILERIGLTADELQTILG